VAVAHGARTITYSQLRERSLRLAAALECLGVEPGDRVAVLSPNTPALLEAHYGVPSAGAVLVAVNTRLTTGEVEYVLEHSGSRVVVVDEELASLVEACPGRAIVRVADTGGEDDPYEAFLAGVEPLATPRPVIDEEDTISLNYTSGTTGSPKGVMYTHRGAYLNALAQVIDAGLTLDSVYLWTLPMFHCNGWCYTWAVTAAAARHVCLRRVDPPLVWGQIESRGVTHMCGAPTVYTAIVSAESARQLEMPLTCMVAGASPSPTLLAQLEELGFRPVHVYGLTETYGPTMICAPNPAWESAAQEQRANLLARQGVAQLTSERAVVLGVDGDRTVADGSTMGEVTMRGNVVMKGYFDDDDATARAFEGGRFRSGDLGVVHDDGYVELRDRAKDVIISGGENVSTIEVEQAVVAHPDVLECAVVAVPDELWGERPKAFATLRKGADVSETEVIAFCRERLAHFKCPDAVEFGELPKTSTGKVQKFVLRDREWGERDRRIN
jgi:fatty-acyl-CoA synthase